MRRFERSLILVVGVAVVSLASVARGQGGTTDYIYQVLFDTDHDAATGCSVPVDDTTVGNTTVDGIDRLVRVTVARTGATGTVTAITLQSCVDDTTFGPPQPVSSGGWPVGTGGGASVIEGFVPAAALANGAPGAGADRRDGDHCPGTDHRGADAKCTRASALWSRVGRSAGGPAPF